MTTITAYDIVLFGATSFVGQITARYLADYQKSNLSDGFSFAIAGRSQAKLDKLKAELGMVDLPVILADSTDALNLKHMVECAQVVISTVGPYDLYGDKLIAACVKAGKGYCDLTGEIHWIKRMIDTHAIQAAQTGARIVNCCGFDSIPSDLGVYFLQTAALKRFGEPCAHIDMRVKAAKGGMSGGTLASITNVFAKATQDARLRKTLKDPYAICPSAQFYENNLTKTKQPSTQKPEYEAHYKKWRAPFIMALINTRVVHRTNALLGGKYGANFTYSEAMWTGDGIKGKMMAYALTGGLASFTMGLSVAPARRLLTKYALPKPGQGPSKQEQETGFFNLVFHGKTSSGERLVAQVKGDKDPGYGATAQMLGQAALCLLKEAPEKGGFWTPASLLGDALIDRLETHTGISFELL